MSVLVVWFSGVLFNFAAVGCYVCPPGEYIEDVVLNCGINDKLLQTLQDELILIQ